MFNVSIERLEQIRAEKQLTQKEFALKLGTTEQSYSHYTKGRREVPLSLMKKVKELYGTSLDWLVDGTSLPTIAKTDTSDKSSTIMIREYDVALSAGAGTYPDEHALIIDARPFSKNWIHQKGLNPASLALVRVNGDSMEPLLRDKDIVMID